MIDSYEVTIRNGTGSVMYTGSAEVMHISPITASVFGQNYVTAVKVWPITPILMSDCKVVQVSKNKRPYSLMSYTNFTPGRYFGGKHGSMGLAILQKDLVL